jgi:mannose-6-phosphate isomerase-like protein (cupin superfamily)
MDATLDGYAWLPRMIDKARAARAGTLGDAVHPCPVDRRCLAQLGIAFEDFTAVIARTETDAEVLEELRALGVATPQEAWFDAPAWEDALQEMVWNSDGETISDRAERNVLILVGDDPGITVTWTRYAPSERGPDLHLHRQHTDAFYILTGTLRFLLGPEGERVVDATPGTYVAAPPEVAHSFFNASDDQATWLNIHAPDAGFAAFLRGARDGVEVPFDSFGVTAPEGGPAGDAIVVAPRADGELEHEAAGVRVVADRFRVDFTTPDGATVAYCRI